MTTPWTADRRAEALLPRRDELVDRLPGVITRAHALTIDERELVVDDALEHVVLGYSSPIASVEEIERVFWTACKHRVARLLHQRRGATVRGRFQRVSDEPLLHRPDPSADPAEIVDRAAELDLAVKFVATLDGVERQVLRVKWLTSDDTPMGYRGVARELGISSARARAAERSIAAKLERFATFCAAGRLCAERSDELGALAVGKDVTVAKAHIKHCAVCKADYIAQLRAVRSAAFQREIASLVPIVPVAEQTRRSAGPARDLVADWLARLLGQEGPAVAAQAAASGVGRGAGGVLALKLAAVLASGAATVGVTTGILSEPKDERQPRSEKATPTATPAPTRTPQAIATPDVAAALAAARRAAQRRADQRRAAEERQQQRQAASGPSSQEDPAPASPAPPGSQPNGASEFTPDSANLPPAAPAPAPVAPGSSEFP